MPGCGRRRAFVYPSVCCGFVVTSSLLVLLHTNTMLSGNGRQNAQLPLSVLCENRKITPISQTNNTPSVNQGSHFFNRAQDAVKSVFNFGEFMRNQGNPDESADTMQELSYQQIEALKRQNLCPEPYRLNEQFHREHEQITHVSNWTIAQNLTRNRYGNYVINASVVNKIINSKPRIVILTPISNAAVNLQHYFKLLCSLDYPHELISVVLGEDSSTDRSYELAHVHSRTLKQYFSKVEVIKFEENIGQQSHFGKHDEFFQFKRRSHLARSRNQLLFQGLRQEDYVMWVDVDVKYIPRDLVQHLLSADKDIVVPSCMFQQPDGSLAIYDRNSWRETPRSLEFLRKQSEDYLKLEGYTVSMRNLLPDINDEGHLVSIDGVGGCVMMVKADCHRKGLIFPPFIYQHHIETEGLAKMAKTMQYGVFGYPMVFVCHW